MNSFKKLAVVYYLINLAFDLVFINLKSDIISGTYRTRNFPPIKIKPDTS